MFSDLCVIAFSVFSKHRSCLCLLQWHSGENSSPTAAGCRTGLWPDSILAPSFRRPGNIKVLFSFPFSQPVSPRKYTFSDASKPLKSYIFYHQIFRKSTVFVQILNKNYLRRTVRKSILFRTFCFLLEFQSFRWFTILQSYSLFMFPLSGILYPGGDLNYE